MSSVAIAAIPNGGQAVLCVRCLDRGHKCYASHVEDGKALCIYCLDNEPCFHEQRRNSATEEKPMPVSAEKLFPASAVATVKPNGAKVPAKTCVGFGRACRNPLGEKNRTGLCAACYARRSYKEKHAAEARGSKKNKQERKKAPHTPAAETFALQVSEAQLNRYLEKLEVDWKELVHTLPVELKLTLVNHVLSSEQYQQDSRGQGS